MTESIKVKFYSDTKTIQNRYLPYGLSPNLILKRAGNRF